MGRRSTRNLIREVLSSLSDGPKTVAEISASTGLDRAAIGRYLELLEEAGLAVAKRKGAGKQYHLVPSFRTDTYFGLPLNQEAERLVHSLFARISEVWRQHTSQPLRSTNVQKILYKVIQECNLESIPHGWYVYGGITVAVFEESVPYEYEGLEMVTKACVDAVTAEYAGKKACEAKRAQYDEFASDEYRIKEEILSILYGGGLHNTDVRRTERSLHMLVKLIRRLFSAVESPQRPRYREIVDAYQDLMLDVATRMDAQTVRGHVREITQLFEAVWKYLALFRFKKDLSRFYPEQLLHSHFELDIVEQEELVVSLGAELQSLLPVEGGEMRRALSQIRLRGRGADVDPSPDPALRRKAGLE